MKDLIIPSNFAEQSNVPSGKLSEALQAYKLDQQTGLVELDIPDQIAQILLFEFEHIHSQLAGINLPASGCDKFEKFRNRTLSPRVGAFGPEKDLPASGSVCKS